MTRFFRSWRRAVAGALPARRRPFVPGVLLLEDRTVPSVQFRPAPYAVPGNRPDMPLAAISATRLVEPYLSVNPTDPANIAVSAQKYLGVSTNADGSLTGTATFPGSMGGDTVTTYDGAGRLFWTNLTAPGGLSGVSIAQVDPITGGILGTHIVDRVPDSSFFDDKEWIAADPGNNNLYVAWSRDPGDLNSAHVLISYSVNQGVSWSDPVQVDNGTDAAAAFVTITVAPDHMVYVAYHSVTENGDVPDHDGKIVVVRLNNDLTNPVRSIAEVPGRADVTDNIQTAGLSRQIPGATFLTRGSTQPWILADPARPGNIYVVSADANNGFHQDYGDIRIARSTDYGLTWSSSLIETSSALFPNAAIDQNGDIVVAWYDNRRGINNAAGHFKLDVYATYSTDGGLTFAAAFPVNDQTPGVNTPNGNIFDPDAGANVFNPGPPPTTRIGEYFGIAISGGTAYVVWNGNYFAGFNNPIRQQVWTKAFAIRGSLTVTGTPGSDYITIRSMASNPAFVEVLVNGQRQYAGLWSALAGITVDATPGDDIVELDSTVAGTPVTINLGDGADTVEIGLAPSDLGAIQAPVTIHGGSGPDILTLEDTLNVSDTSYTIMSATVLRTGAATISYDHIRQLVIRGGNVSDAYNVVGPTPSAVQIMAGSGSNTVTVDDRSNAADTTYTVAGLSIARTGSAAISFAANGGSITNLFIYGDDGNNAYNFQSTPSGSSTTLNSGDGVDTVNVRGTAGPLLINSGSGGDTITLSNATGTLGGIGRVIINDPSSNTAVTVDDSAFTGSTRYTLTSTQVAADAWPNFLLVYNNVASLNLNGSEGDDAFAIESTASVTTTTVTAGSGSNCFDLTPTAQYLAEIAGPLNLFGSGNDTLAFWDQNNPNAETYTFDDIPSLLTLATVPTFATSWSGMGAVYLETNGMSTVDDPSGMVPVDVPPPHAPNTAQEPPRTPFRAVDDSLMRAWLAADPQRPTMSPAVLAADLRHPWAQKPKEEPDLLVGFALDG